MFDWRSALGLLIPVLACNSNPLPVAPAYDPLEGVTELVVEVPAEMLRVGAYVDVRILNGSAKSVSSVLPCRLFDIERQDADAWVALPSEIFGCVARPTWIAAGRIYEETLRLPADGAPGIYRIAFPHLVEPGELATVVSNTFRVEPTGVMVQAP